MSDCHIISHYPSDTLGTSIEYRSANLYNTYIMYNPADVRWHVLIDIISRYYPCYYRIFGLNALKEDSVHDLQNYYMEVCPQQMVQGGGQKKMVSPLHTAGKLAGYLWHEQICNPVSIPKSLL